MVLGSVTTWAFECAPCSPGPLDKPGTCTYGWLVTIQIKLLPYLSVSVQVAGVCVCALRRPGLTLWLLGWGLHFFCQTKLKVRNSILYWFTEMQLLTFAYYFWPYNSHPPKGGLLLHIFIYQWNVWFSLFVSPGFLLQTTDMCLGWIGDSKLTCECECGCLFSMLTLWWAESSFGVPPITQRELGLAPAPCGPVRQRCQNHCPRAKTGPP